MPRVVDRSARLDAACDAVIRLAEERGFADVTVRAVAAAMGASTSTVTHYVDNRDQLLTLALRREIRARQEELHAATAGLAGAAALRAILDWVLGDGRRAHRLWLAMIVGAQTEPVVRRELAAFDSWWDGLVSDLLRAELGPGPRLQAVVAMVGMLVDGAVVAASRDEDRSSVVRRRLVIEEWLVAVLPPGEGP